ncbi:Serine/threonine-protein kinase PknB [Stieleria maiorica]|uniref:Serine/threonine-protein kinase PknB n=1 Tax=Stieleria maiorica TaxID=2795974 RepID=A0A5B9M9W8_9BACT|nr:serine/threonine-protein kinase [Stieleria maiorica]QEF97329.1 Serine/threonine-protein kinase PknB [Stieleria maiorica]
MSDTPCPRCGTPIPTDPASADSAAPAQCPRCLLRPPWDKPHPVAITLGPGQSFVPPSIEELSGQISGYEVEALIGQGGMGAVYLGRQKSLDRAVAIKILPPQIAERAGFRERFAQEGRALAKLNHPNIVSVHDFGQAGPYAMLVMELVEGANLREVLAQGRLSPAEALEIIPQLCDALAYAHDEGVVHRDIKPENLLFDSRGRLKITDFGLAKLVANKTAVDAEEGTTAESESPAPDPTQGVVGTVHYMAPEQLENPRSVDHRADIYALGVVFYEMLTGELPIGRFEPPSQLLNGAASRQIPKVSIDVRLDDVVLRALEKHPEKRYATASAVMHDLDEIEKTPHQTAQAATSPDDPWQRVHATVHRAGNVASEYASTSMETTGTWISQAVNRRLTNPRVEVPAYIALGIAIVGAVGTSMWLGVPRGEAMALLWCGLTTFLAIVFARVSLARESESGSPQTFLVSRLVLGGAYLIIALPILIAPIIASVALWVEIYDEPRDIGRMGWIRDWVQVVSTTVVATAASWLLLLGAHAVFPKLLAVVFRPFVTTTTRLATIPLAIGLIALIGGGVVTAHQFPYLSYTPGIPVEESNWDKLSPRDFKEMQRELNERRLAEGDSLQ